MTDHPPRAVLFDLDGTLVDTSRLWQAAYVAMADALGVALPDRWWDEVRGRSLTASLAVFGVPSWITSSGELGSVELEAALVGHAERRLGAIPVTWLPGARRLLAAAEAAGIATAVVTSTWRGLAQAMLTAGNVVVPVVGGDEVARGKPAPDSYLLAAARLAVDPESCLVVEDSATGVAAAEAAGMRVLVVPSGAALPTAHGRTQVRSLTEVDVRDLRALLV